MYLLSENNHAVVLRHRNIYFGSVGVLGVFSHLLPLSELREIQTFA